ncbi:MAG: ATP-binding protein [Patescibacteria group bacterium]|nr:ATP-binding protein [Patescibacteria group bacterium]
MEFVLIFFVLVSIVVFVLGIFFYRRSLKLKKKLEEERKNMQRKMYELAILKELGERIGYSLNVQNIIDIITGSLHQFIEYQVVSYMLLQPEKVIFKIHLEESVSRKFIKDIKTRMLKSLSALLNKEFSESQVEEVLTGAVIIDEIESPVQSFFNIPLVIGEKVVGVLTVAHSNPGLYKEEETTILYKITRQASEAVTRLQDVISNEQKKLSAMVESMSEGVVMTDNDYRILVANPAMKQILHIEKEEITIFDFIDNLEGKFDIRGKLEESVKLDKILPVTEVLLDNRYFHILVSPVKVNSGINKGDIIGGVVIFYDISKEKELEKMREDFTSMMVHELRSPLTGIKGISEVMILENKKKKRAKKDSEYATVLLESSSRMLDLVNDLLDVSKISAGKFEIHKEVLPIKDFLKTNVEILGTLAKESKIDLKVSIAKNVPEKVFLDKNRIGQSLINLLSNAIKFTKEGGSVTVQVMSHNKGESIVKEGQENNFAWFIDKDKEEFTNLPSSLFIAVTDSAFGIAEDDIKNLFNKFKQLEASVRSDHKGTGLGLSIVKGIVEAHDGIVGVFSKEGSGSTFYFAIPFETNVIS